jgi:hypothetical protein
MKNENPQKEQEEIQPPIILERVIIDSKGAERFTAHVKNASEYTLGEVYNFDSVLYRLAAILKDGDGVSLEFVKQ